LDYWSGLHDYLSRNEKMIRPPKPLPQQWMTFGVGRAGFHLNAIFQREEKRIRVELIITQPTKLAFRSLEATKDDINREFGAPLSWEEMSDKKSSRVALYRDGVDVADSNTWNDQFRWYAEQIKTFRRVFTTRIRALNLEAPTPEETS
jgi:Domain of unknown function (DUF4268)